ncbi:hypothetical protein [Brevundimonas sp.]|uniref:hypothetical protein n=1 Tax=Brevundimonas sp. TaxID=1871086 RepID=UPI0025DC9B9D|nr:hypothetical protein [Brevundimonas sp.]
MFKKAILPLAAVTALSAAVPAAAQTISVSFGYGQDYGGRYDRGDRYDRHDRWDRGWDRIEHRIQRLDRRIDQGVRSGQISRREAYSLRMQFRALVQLEQRYSRGGLNEWERRDLNQRFDRLSRQIRYERRDRDHRRW